MARRKRQSGLTLIEALMASALLAMAAAGILLPITAAAAAQTDAQRRVIATRLAADVIEQVAAESFDDIMCPDEYSITYDTTSPNLAQLGYPLSYKNYKCDVKTNDEYLNKGTPQEVKLILLTVKVFDNNRPMITLKTLIGGGHL